MPKTLTHKGRTLTLAQWAARLGCHRNTLEYRLKNGWSVEAALARPPQQYRSLTFNGETLPLPEWAERLGCAPQVLDKRLKDLGWSVERALTTPVGGWRSKTEVAFKRLVLDIDQALRVYAAATDTGNHKCKARGDERGGAGLETLSEPQ